MKKRFHTIIAMLAILSVLSTFSPLNVFAAGRALSHSQIYISPTQWAGNSEYAINAIPDTIEMLKGNTPVFAGQQNSGGYYYAYSDFTKNHSEAFGNIKLPTGFNNENRRNAFIAFGITSPDGYGIDAVIKNEGSGWWPCVYDTKGNTFTEWSEYKAPSTATNAKIVFKPINNTTVGLYIQWLNSSGNPVYSQGQTGPFDMNISISSRPGLVDTSGASGFNCRFYRFASFVPKTGDGSGDNRNDGSYMTGGMFLNLGIYNKTRNAYDNWGIGTSQISVAWITHPENCSVTSTTTSDAFVIRHNNHIS